MKKSLASAAAVFALGLGALAASPTASAEILFRGHTTSDLSEFRHQFYRDYGAQAVTSPIREGKYGVRFEMRSSDTKVKRAEIQPPSKDPAYRQEIGEEAWYTVSMMLPSGWATGNETQTLLQGHQKSGCQPALALRVDGDRWVLKSRSAGTDCTNSKTRSYSLGRIETGKWVDWTMRIKWSYKSDGILQVWKNGTRVVNQSGPNLYNADQGPAVRFGLYKGRWRGANRQVYYADSFRVGDSRESLSSMQKR
jgi:hypothetical protein